MKTQKAVIVRADAHGGGDHCKLMWPEELNELLAKGWRAVMSTPMGGGGQTHGAYCLVILEKDE